MKIYILRHEERDVNNPSFLSPLTENGLQNAKQLALKLKEYNITHIFTSPFLRTLQTIRDYCKLENKKAYREFSLYEFIDSQIGSPNNYLFDVPIDYQDMIDFSYHSFYKMEDIKWDDSYETIKKRVKMFIEYLQNAEIINNKDNANILLVTHMTIVNAILNKEAEEEYPMGKITLL
tara:strand:+ start:933 stop:1463 length:531 start_codon:yes stop_codon:yes gene_type:complete